MPRAHVKSIDKRVVRHLPEALPRESDFFNIAIRYWDEQKARRALFSLTRAAGDSPR
jgi:hypothetical protein